MAAIARVPQPRAELTILDAVDLPDKIHDLKCVILWGDRSRKTGHVGREIKQVSMSKSLTKKNKKVTWDPKTRMKKLFLPMTDLRRMDLEVSE